MPAPDTFSSAVQNSCVPVFSLFRQIARLPPCDHGWVTTPSGGGCVKLFDNRKVTWYDARRACKSTGGDLVSLYRKDMRKFIIEEFVQKSKGSIWVGLRKFRGADRWSWVDGDVTEVYSQWRRYEKVWCVFLLRKRQ
ncbi:C-type lectin, partial [Plakobranchus ocellatus]